jgi:hypothetical protein
MTQTIESVDEIMDFTVPRKRVRFRIDDDIFEAASALPTLTALEMTAQAEKFGSGTSEEQRNAITAIFSAILLHDSATLFISRLSDADHPIDIKQIAKVMPWVIEQYGLRPTSPSSDSSDSSDEVDDGTSLTGSAAAAGSTSDASSSTAS